MDTKESKDSICRVCLAADKKCMSLFEEWRRLFIYLHINKITNTDIKENDGLPDKICAGCLLDLDTVINFIEQCERSNEILHSHRNEDNVVIKNEEPYYDIEVLDDDDYYFDNGSFKSDDCDEKKPIEAPSPVERCVKKSRAVDLQLQCDDCKEFFKSKCKLRVHWNKVHICKSFICPQCKCTFKSSKALLTHTKRGSRSCLGAKNVRIEGVGRNRIFYCKSCDFKTLRIKTVLTHLVIHTGEKPYTCDICLSSFTQLSTLNFHKESYHSSHDVQMKCPHCDKLYKPKILSRHIKLVHNNAIIECSICQKSFKNKVTLKSHMMRHSGVKSLTCEFCAENYFTLSELRNHKVRVHLNLKRTYKCELCDFKSQRKQLLAVHVAQHSTSKLPCTMCGWFFHSTQRLQEHQKQHFEEKKISCPYCDKMYHNKDSLRQHKNKKHKEIHEIVTLKLKSDLLKIKNREKKQKHKKKLIEVKLSPASNG